MEALIASNDAFTKEGLSAYMGWNTRQSFHQLMRKDRYGTDELDKLAKYFGVTTPDLISPYALSDGPAFVEVRIARLENQVNGLVTMMESLRARQPEGKADKEAFKMVVQLREEIEQLKDQLKDIKARSSA